MNEKEKSFTDKFKEETLKEIDEKMEVALRVLERMTKAAQLIEELEAKGLGKGGDE